MSDQPSSKVSAQKPASAHLKTVLINTVVPSHFCQDYRRVQAGQLPGCGHLVLVSRLAQQRSHPLDERLAAQQPAMRRGLKGVCRSPRQSLLDEPPVGRLGIVAARLATPGRMQSLEGGIPVSEHLFARRTTTTARLMDDAEAMGNDLDPVLCTVGPATAHRRPHAIQLLGRLFPTDLPSPAGPTFRLSATELLPFRERVQDGIGMPGAMAAVARPGILARIGHHRGPHRVGLDVPQNDEQVVAALDDRGSAAALPDVAAGSLSPVVPPGVSDGQGLEDAADRLSGGRLEKQMKMVGHQAVAEERERIPCLGAGEIAKEHIPFAVGAEDIGSVVPAVDRVVNKVIACQSWKSSHESNLPT